MKKYLAFDLGAESGRCVLGSFEQGRLKLDEIHRFPNRPVRIFNSIYWNAPGLFAEIKQGLKTAVRKHGASLDGIGVDSWGVDFALLGKNDTLLGLPHHYRDSRTDGVMEEAFKRIPRRRIFELTGIQFMQINTIYQLFSMVLNKSPLLDVAEELLMMAGFFNYLLSGKKVAEFSLASTSQAYDPRKGCWSKELFTELGLPLKIMPEIVKPATIIGLLAPSVAKETGSGEVPVIAAVCHDTASAIAAVPAAEGKKWAYLSCGTWSLIGVETHKPVINDKAFEYGFTNEGGVNNTFRFLKNIMGLWLVQECKRTWEKQGEGFSYDELTRLAQQAAPFRTFIDPNESAFLGPGDMPGRIGALCGKTGQPEPPDKGGLVRCILESLAFTYRLTLERLEDILSNPIEVLHIVGGGTRNKLLCQFTANAIERPVIAGPVEAAAAGNLIIQAVATGELSSIEEARGLVKNSFEVTAYQPADTASWKQAYGRFKDIIEKNG